MKLQNLRLGCNDIAKARAFTRCVPCTAPAAQFAAHAQMYQAVSAQAAAILTRGAAELGVCGGHGELHGATSDVRVGGSRG